MAVTRKIRQKGADGAVTEVDIGALAANVVTNDERQFVSKAEKEEYAKGGVYEITNTTTFGELLAACQAGITKTVISKTIVPFWAIKSGNTYCIMINWFPENTVRTIVTDGSEDPSDKPITGYAKIKSFNEPNISFNTETTIAGFVNGILTTTMNNPSQSGRIVCEDFGLMTASNNDGYGYVSKCGKDPKTGKYYFTVITASGSYKVSGNAEDSIKNFQLITLLPQRGADPTADDELTTKRYVDAAIAAGKPSSTPIYVEVPASGWNALPTASGGGYVNTISVSGVKATDNLEIVSAVEANTAQATAKVWRKMMGYIDSGLTGDGNVILICKTKQPTADFKIALLGV